jgi:hypothetical protein
MDVLNELMAVSKKEALKFFYDNLEDIVGKYEDAYEVLYVARILADRCQTSCASQVAVSSFTDLSQVFDTFVLRQRFRQDKTAMEIAGAQTLFLAGFFGNQMKRRHNLNWYYKQGSGFFKEASKLNEKQDLKKSLMLKKVSFSFRFWAEVCSKLERNRLVIRI